MSEYRILQTVYNTFIVEKVNIQLNKHFEVNRKPFSEIREFKSREEAEAYKTDLEGK